jgi:hypothetical protein
MHVCIYTHTHTHTHTHIHKHTSVYIAGVLARERAGALIVGDTLFVHAGLSTQQLAQHERYNNNNNNKQLAQHERYSNKIPVLYIYIYTHTHTHSPSPPHTHSHIRILGFRVWGLGFKILQKSSSNTISQIIFFEDLDVLTTFYEFYKYFVNALRW